jgi:hypothetical protein
VVTDPKGCFILRMLSYRLLQLVLLFIIILVVGPTTVRRFNRLPKMCMYMPLRDCSIDSLRLKHAAALRDFRESIESFEQIEQIERIAGNWPETSKL